MIKYAPALRLAVACARQRHAAARRLEVGGAIVCAARNTHRPHAYCRPTCTCASLCTCECRLLLLTRAMLSWLLLPRLRWTSCSALRSSWQKQRRRECRCCCCGGLLWHTVTHTVLHSNNTWPACPIAAGSYTCHVTQSGEGAAPGKCQQQSCACPPGDDQGQMSG